MANTDAIVLGAGIVGTSVAVHLAKKGLSVALVDRGRPGEGTSFGNAGIIEGSTLFPPAFPSDPPTLLRILFKRTSEVNYHLSFLPQVAPWLFSFYQASSPKRLLETAVAMRPLFASALAEHEALLAEAGAQQYLRKQGWLKIYRTQESFDAVGRERDFARGLNIPLQVCDTESARRLEPSLAPVFRRAVFWPQAAALTDPLAVTSAYAERFAALGGVLLKADSRSLHRNGARWRLDTAQGAIDASTVVVALGPWAPDVLDPLGIRLPLGIKRGYHRHFRPQGDARLSRPVLDAENGYVMTPMQQGLRVTTGAEFAARDAPPTPVQFARLLPRARRLFPPLGEPVEAEAWLGCRPCFADSRPVIGRAPGQDGLWLAYGHGHWGLTLGPVTGRLIAEMITAATPICDPAPYSAERFGRGV